MRIETESAAETEAAGARFGGGLRPGDVVLVAGELGSGKTTFVRGACGALAVRGPVTSPTFTIGQLYEGAVPVAHLDLFRLGGDADLAILDDYLTDKRVAFVEWPGAVDAVVPRLAARVAIAHEGGDRRSIEIEDLR